MAILTISREYGSGGWEIGRGVAEKLGYQFVDKERVFQDLQKAGTQWGRLARELDEVCPTLWERHDWQYRGYVAQTEALVLSYAEVDNVVLIGRGASFLLQGVPFSLRVRLVAPLEVRLERIMTRERLSREAAARLITQMDGDRACYVKANYGSDWDLEQVYDLTLNTGGLSYDPMQWILRPPVSYRFAADSPGVAARVVSPEVASSRLLAVHRRATAACFLPKWGRASSLAIATNVGCRPYDEGGLRDLQPYSGRSR